RRGLISWCLYDWANSPYATLVMTFVFAVYFQQAVVGDPARSDSLWGYAMAASAVVIAVMSPLFGAVADRSGRQKPWLFGFTLLLAGCAAGLWWVEPQDASG